MKADTTNYQELEFRLLDLLSNQETAQRLDTIERGALEKIVSARRRADMLEICGQVEREIESMLPLADAWYLTNWDEALELSTTQRQNIEKMAHIHFFFNFMFGFGHRMDTKDDARKRAVDRLNDMAEAAA